MTDEMGIMNKALQEYENAKRLKNINQELYDQLAGSIYYLLKYSEKYNIPLPKKDELIRMVKKSHFLMDQFSHPTTLDTKKTDDNFTEPEN